MLVAAVVDARTSHLPAREVELLQAVLVEVELGVMVHRVAVQRDMVRVVVETATAVQPAVAAVALQLFDILRRTRPITLAEDQQQPAMVTQFAHSLRVVRLLLRHAQVQTRQFLRIIMLV